MQKLWCSPHSSSNLIHLCLLGCCTPNMKIELFLRNVSLTSNWSNEFLAELASQLNLRVSQFEIVNFYVVGAYGLNITMDIAPHSGISFSTDQVTTMNYSLSSHRVQINPVILTWFRSLAFASGNIFCRRFVVRYLD
jgi:hypothetical protein